MRSWNICGIQGREEHTGLIYQKFGVDHQKLGVTNPNGELTNKNGESTIKNGDLSIKNGEFSKKNGESWVNHQKSWWCNVDRMGIPSCLLLRWSCIPTKGTRMNFQENCKKISSTRRFFNGRPSLENVFVYCNGKREWNFIKPGLSSGTSWNLFNDCPAPSPIGCITPVSL